MGLTCTSLHVFAPQAMNLDEFVQATGERLGCQRVENADEADRELIAVPAPPWISFFDLSNPDAVTDEVMDLAKQLSAVSHRPVLLTSIWDSDAFGFLLFERGKQVDGYASMRGLLPGRTKKWPPQMRAAEWGRVFERMLSAEAIESVMERGLVFADDLLIRICNLLGLSPEIARSTSRDLKTQALPHQQCYYFRNRPQPGTSVPVTQTLAYKGPCLTCEIPLGGVASIPVELNAPAGAFIDPVLEFSGSALDSGIVSVTDAYGLWSLGLEHIRAGGVRRVDAEITSAEAEGRRSVSSVPQGIDLCEVCVPAAKEKHPLVVDDVSWNRPGHGRNSGLLPAERYSAGAPAVASDIPCRSSLKMPSLGRCGPYILC